MEHGIRVQAVATEPFQLLSESWYEEDLMPLLAEYLAVFCWEVTRLPFDADPQNPRREYATVAFLGV